MQRAVLRKPLFGKEVEIAVWDIDPRLASGILQDAYERGRQLERVFNLYDKGSVLSELNRRRRLDSPELARVMGKALELCEKTGGRYDISLGRQFLARKSGKQAEPPECSYKDIIIKNRTIELTNDDV